MVDRVTTYVGAVPAAKDVLKTGQFGMVALGKLAAGVLGTNVIVNGFTCTPTVPATLNVILTPGEIYQLENLEQSIWSVLPADNSHIIVKQGIMLDPNTRGITPPATVGYSQVYLISVQYQDVDTQNQVLNYYNFSNPDNPYYGLPIGGTGSGAAQSTVRAGVAAIQVNAGSAAPTGTQTAPSAPAGFTGLYLITVANGATTITSGNIVRVATAPFIPATLPAIPAGVQKHSWTYAVAFGTANALSITLDPPPSAIVAGFGCDVRLTLKNTTAATITVNGFGPYPIVIWDGLALSGGEMLAGAIATLQFDGVSFRLLNPAQPRVLGAPRTYYVSLTGLDTNDGLLSTTAFRTIQKAVDVTRTFNMNNFSVLINVANGTYAPFTCARLNGAGFCTIRGNLTTPANVLINAASGEAVFVTASGYGLEGMSVASAANGTGISVGAGIRVQDGTLSLTRISFGACVFAQLMVGSNGTVSISGADSGNPTDFINITGDSPFHINAINGGTALIGGTILNTFGSRTFDTFVNASIASKISSSYSAKNLGGSVTGKRYNVSLNSVIATGTGDQNHFPGTIAGTFPTGGQYS